MFNTKFQRLNVEDLIGCKLCITLGETKLQGRSFEEETN